MDEGQADELWHQFKETDTAAKRGHGIGFDYEQQYQEALEKAYPVSSGADRVQRGGHDEGGLLDRFKKAAEDPSLQPGHDVLSVRDRIKARIKHALTEKERAAKSDDRQWTQFVAARKRELTGLEAIVDAQGNMLGSTYHYSAADTADLDVALSAAVAPQSAAQEDAHAAAIFGNQPVHARNVGHDRRHGGGEPSSRYRGSDGQRSRDHDRRDREEPSSRYRGSDGQRSRDHDRRDREEPSSRYRGSDGQGKCERDRRDREEPSSRYRGSAGQGNCERDRRDREGNRGACTERKAACRDGDKYYRDDERDRRHASERAGWDRDSHERDERAAKRRGREQDCNRDTGRGECAHGRPERHGHEKKGKRHREERICGLGEGREGTDYSGRRREREEGDDYGSMRHDTQNARWESSRQERDVVQSDNVRHAERHRNAAVRDVYGGTVAMHGEGGNRSKQRREGDCDTRRQGADGDSADFESAGKVVGKDGGGAVANEFGPAYAEVVRLDAAMRQAMAAVPEGATVVLEEEIKGEEDLLQHEGLDSSFVQATGGSWRDRMKKKVAG